MAETPKGETMPEAAVEQAQEKSPASDGETLEGFRKEIEAIKEANLAKGTVHLSDTDVSEL